MKTKKGFKFILQVRTGSQRLPQKMILPFYENKTIPEVIIERLQLYFPEIPIVIATTTNSGDDELVSLLNQYNVCIYRGAEHNVLDRFIEAGDNYEVDEFIRICADNPFLDMILMKELLNTSLVNLDYCSFKINNKPAMKTAFGFFAEASRISVLKRVKSLTSDMLYQEHVTNFIYENPNVFNTHWLAVDDFISKNDNVRLTVDTQSDFDIASKVFKHVILKNEQFTYSDIITYVNQQGLIETMIKTNQQNQK